ncbi:MAG: glycoside hydrolase family 2 [Gammaproteobacteria bacterium]|nr:glycoside hydrolase family 2 [Gammaproteobacteria bacterium]
MDTTSLPRSEYPRPILTRPNWLNLNGIWDFEVDEENRGYQEDWPARTTWDNQIIVPFAPGTSASSVSLDYDPTRVWYHRTFSRPDWPESETILHIGACDYHTRVYVNGGFVGEHRGGYSPVRINITSSLTSTVNHLVICAEDSGSWQQPRGKQAGDTRWPIDYDPIIGIWQTVWLEPVQSRHIVSMATGYKITEQSLDLTITLSSQVNGSLQISLRQNAAKVSELTIDTGARSEVKASLAINSPELWSPDCPTLYDLYIQLLSPSGQQLDSIQSYTGLREISILDGKLCLNQQPLYIKGLLDQGYFPEGWYTPLDDAAMIRDIELVQAMGFNLVRKHQKAEDPRFLYWADRKGLMVWSEMPSGRIFCADLIEQLTLEWLQLMRRDQPHPCVICWVPFNESWGVWHQRSRSQQRAFVDATVALTKSMDSSRPVIGNDGWEYSSGDLFTLHLYDNSASQLIAKLRELIANPQAHLSSSEQARPAALPGADPSGLPLVLSECGGIGYVNVTTTDELFAYGDLPETPAALSEKIQELANALTQIDELQGFVWTQLTDIQQEINGLLYFDRTPKLPLDQIKALFDVTGDT